MARLFGILVAIFTLSACSSGVSNSGAGGSSGGTDLVLTASLNPDSFSSDAFASGEDEEGDPEQLVSTDFASMDIEIFDPIGRYSNTFQGVRFTTFEITYIRGNGGAPKLGPRVVHDTLTIILSNNTGSGSVDLPIVDNVIKKQFRDQASGSTIFNYVARVRAIGRDIATNSRVVAEAEITFEMGEFVE